MTIRKQFVILSIFIISIPILCITFVIIYQYFKSPDRYLVKGYQTIRALDEIPLNDRDKEKLYETLQLMAPDVQSAIFTNEYNLISTDFPEFKESKVPESPQELWGFLKTTSDNWFYQLTTLPVQDSTLMIISRTPRERQQNRWKGRLIKPLAIFVILLIGIALFSIIYIFTTIARSIKAIQAQMQNITNGDINDKIEIQNKKLNEITSITTNLEKMRLSLVESQNKKNKFIMGMSHDLRTPIAIIKGYTEAISDGMVSDGEEMEKTLSLINAKTTQLQSMIDTLINFVKLESNDWRENLIEESLLKVVDDFAKDAKVTCAVFKRHMKFEKNFTEDIKVPLDKQLVNRAFENLLSNAIRYTKENDTITLRANVINEEDKKYVILQIQDTGCGIDESDFENIFDLFYRGTNSRREEGMGIGLSVVKSIIDTHGWNINVESEKGKGTTFSINVPV